MSAASSSPPVAVSDSVKQVLVLRTRFEIPEAGQIKLVTPRKGKLIAQGAHASLAAVLGTAFAGGDTYPVPLDADLAAWINGGAKKIAVGVETEADLLRVYEAARAAGLRVALIQDAGKTEFGGRPTYTAVAVGPNAAARVDAVTGDLKLL